MKKEKNGNSMFLNKDGYAKSVDVQIPDQNLEIDPRGKSSFRGKGVYIATGDVTEVKGTKRMLAEKKKEATWY